MPKVITQHRRGTKDEWEKSNIRPDEAELVVEQENGRSKIKIGDGKKLYPDLPYITDEVENELKVQANRVDNLVTLAEKNPDNYNTLESEIIDIEQVMIASLIQLLEKLSDLLVQIYFL